MRAHVFKSGPSSGNIAAMAIGATALAGLTVMLAMPKVRRSCGRWIDQMMDGFVNRTSDRSNKYGNNSGKTLGDWEVDMNKAEELKGPLKTRKDPAVINVPSAGTTAWKDDWSAD